MKLGNDPEKEIDIDSDETIKLKTISFIAQVTGFLFLFLTVEAYRLNVPQGYFL